MVPVGMLHTYFVWVGPTAVPLSQPVAGGAADADPGASSVTAAAAPSSAAKTAALPQCDRVRASTRVVPTLPSLRPRCYRSQRPAGQYQRHRASSTQLSGAAR